MTPKPKKREGLEPFKLSKKDFKEIMESDIYEEDAMTPQNLPRTEDLARDAFYGPHQINKNTKMSISQNRDVPLSCHEDIIRSIKQALDTERLRADGLQAKLDEAEKEVGRLNGAEKALDDQLAIQQNEPSTKTDGYMAGLLNGMLLAKANFGHDYNPISYKDEKLAQLQARVGEESKLYQENIDIWQRKYSDAIEIKERYKKALEFYADRYHYDDGTGMVGKLVSSSEVHGEPTDADWEPDFGHIARNALKLNRYGHELGCTCTPGCEFENGWG